GDIPFGELDEQENERRHQQPDPPRNRHLHVHHFTTPAHRSHSKPSSATSGRCRQQRPHLWRSVGVTVTFWPSATDATMNNSARSPPANGRSGTVTSASRLERTCFSRR